MQMDNKDFYGDLVEIELLKPGKMPVMPVFVPSDGLPVTNITAADLLSIGREDLVEMLGKDHELFALVPLAAKFGSLPMDVLEAVVATLPKYRGGGGRSFRMMAGVSCDRSYRDFYGSRVNQFVMDLWS
jgi:hypothetical protein